MCYAFFNTFVFFVYKSLLFTLEKCLKADFACACLVANAVIRKRRTSSTLYLMNGHAKRVFKITAKTVVVLQFTDSNQNVIEEIAAISVV